MFEPYVPRKFCREFYEIEEKSLQLSLIMATVKGVKPCMDAWVSSSKYDKYCRICKRYGLFVKPDARFKCILSDAVPQHIIGREGLNTTHAFGLPFRRSGKEGAVHVFISRSKYELEKCFWNGWYPVIIEGRVIDRPLVDALNFGYNLGYPECCVRYFQEYNDWGKYSYLVEVIKNTPQGGYHYFCNPFLKDSTYSYIYHMPCSYNCAKTINLVKKIRSVIGEEEPDFVKLIDAHLRLPCLVFFEGKIYVFEGECRDNRIYYGNVHFAGMMPKNNLYEQDLKKGDCVFVENNDVVILKKGRAIRRIKAPENVAVPETRFIVEFQ